MTNSPAITFLGAIGTVTGSKYLLEADEEAPPKTIFITHGEPAAAAALRDRLSSLTGFHAEIPTEQQISKLE